MRAAVAHLVEFPRFLLVLRQVEADVGSLLPLDHERLRELTTHLDLQAGGCQG